MSSTISKKSPKRTADSASDIVRRRADAGAAISNGAGASVPWYRSTLAMGLYGGLLLYASFPPLSLAPQAVVSLLPSAESMPWLMTGAKLVPCLLAWVATVPWLMLVRMERLPGRRPFRMLYLAGLVHWLLLAQWVRLGHWAAHFGWIALALYLAAYLPAFIWLARIATRRLRVPLVLAAPTIWVGLEVLRGWLLTGFSMALLAHTQVDWLSMIQISDLAGAYVVSFVVIFIAACITQMIPERWINSTISSPSPAGASSLVNRSWPALAAIAVLIAVLGYGRYRLTEIPPGIAASGERIALVQGSIDTVFGDETLNQRTRDQYLALTHEAILQRPAAILWPESTLPLNALEYDPSGQLQKGRWFEGDERQFAEMIGHWDRVFRQSAFNLGLLPDDRHIPLILGGTTLRVGPYEPQRLNSAIYVDEQGQVDVDEAYHKMHPVMFGEYAPGGNLFPWIYTLMPIDEGLTPGQHPQVFGVGPLKLSPSICYENTVPHLIRRQVAQLRDAGCEPDVLVTLSNDGWFRGSAELDMHLACGQFRAIELRKPALIAANTGFSAHIDGNGRLIEKGPRRRPQVLLVDVRPDGRNSVYSRIGDWPANACLLFCAIVVGVGLFRGRNGPFNRAPEEPAEVSCRRDR